MHAFGGIGRGASCGFWWMGSMELGNGYGFFPSDKGRYHRMRAIHFSWAGSIFLMGCCMMEREFTKTVYNEEEGSTVMSKTGGRFCAATGGVT